MKLVVRETLSLCGVCYRTVPAIVTYDRDGVTLGKRCAQHGEQTAMLERDSLFYAHVSGLRSPSIYDGYLVDVTERCNLDCEYCYFPVVREGKEANDSRYRLEDVVLDCKLNRRSAPFVLTGGEPTMREDISDLVHALKPVGQVEMLTNGLLLVCQEMYERLLPELTLPSGLCLAHLSVHRRETTGWAKFLERCAADGVTLASALIVVDSHQDFLDAIKWCVEHRTQFASFRLKAATGLWNSKSAEPIFVSDMWRWLEESGHSPRLMENPGTNNKSVFVNVAWDGLWLMLVSWHNVGNVDLLDIACPPFYRARNGEVLNFVHAALVNEGMRKGWLDGRRLDDK